MIEYITRATQRRTRLKRCERRKRIGALLCAGWWGGRRSDHHPFKPQSWSGARETAVEMERLFKAVTPLSTLPSKKEAARALLRPLFFAAEEVFGKAG